MSLGMPVFHNGGKRYLNFLLNKKQWGNGGARGEQQGRSINWAGLGGVGWGVELQGWEGFFLFS